MGNGHRCQLKPGSFGISRFYLSLDPPKSPLRRGVGVDFEKTPIPFLRGARVDLDLIVKQQSLTGFDVKLTLMGTAVSLLISYQSKIQNRKSKIPTVLPRELSKIELIRQLDFRQQPGILVVRL